MFPQSNPSMSQPNRRPPLPGHQMPNRAGALNQNGQGPQNQDRPPMRYGSGAPDSPQQNSEGTPPQGGTMGGLMGSAMGQAPMGDSMQPSMPPPMPQSQPPAPRPMGADTQSAPMPPAAQEGSMGPMKPPMPYMRQQMGQQQQMQRRIQPQQPQSQA